MDPISLVGGVAAAASLIKAAVELSRFIVDFQKGMVGVDEDIQGLITDVNAVKNVADNIAICIDSEVMKRAKQRAQEQPSIGSFSALEQQLEHCINTINRLKSILNSFNPARSSTIVNRAIKCFSFDSRRKEINNARENIRANQHGMSLSLSAIML